MYIDAEKAYNKKRDTFDVPMLDVFSIVIWFVKTPFQVDSVFSIISLVLRQR